MEIHKYILWVHVASGFLALFVGLIPMITKKGSRKHIVSGRIYFYAMFGVFLTSTLMFLLQPGRLLFLFLIAGLPWQELIWLFLVGRQKVKTQINPG